MRAVPAVPLLPCIGGAIGTCWVSGKPRDASCGNICGPEGAAVQGGKSCWHPKGRTTQTDPTQKRNQLKRIKIVSTSTLLKIFIHNYLVRFGHFSHSPSTVLHRVLKNDFSRFWFFQSNQIASLTPNHQDETSKMIEEQPETWHWDLAKWIFGDELHANLEAKYH